MIRAKRLVVVAGGALLLACGLVFAGPAVMFQGVFNGKGVFIVDGKRELLAPGESSVRGFRLHSLKVNEAVLEMDGRRVRVAAGAVLGGDGDDTPAPLFSAPNRQEVKIFPDKQGMYFVQGKINNRPVRFLVDTGATTVSMSSVQAKRLGIDYRRGENATAATASGVSAGYLVVLPRVDVGMVSIANVAAMVIEGDYPPMALLGNSFLQKVEMSREGMVMTLRRKW